MTASWQREWRQFRILARDGVRTLLNSAMLARDADPAQFALWTTALVATPPALFGFGQLFKYSTLRNAPTEVVAAIVRADRMFFVVYGLIAAALLAALTWDALYLERDEQEILGALPVRPRTATAARLAAALTVATAFAIAVSLPSALTFSLVSVSHPVAGFLPLAVLAHLVATTLGCVTAFTTLLVLRGVASLALGETWTNRLATGLQLVTVVALVEVFFYLPSLLPRLVRTMNDGGPSAWWVPAAWFGAVYNGIAGPRLDVYAGEAAMGATALVVALALVIPLYLLPARALARRILESTPGGRRRSPVNVFLRGATSLVARSGPGSSVARFALLSLARSRRHVLLVVTYVGAGAALALIQVLAASVRGGLRIETPRPALLAIPLILVVALTGGMRAAFRLPRDFDANWVFRLHSPATALVSSGTRAALLLSGVAPVVLLAVLGAQAAGWSLQVTLTVGIFNVLAGVLVVEALLCGWCAIPFACARPDSQYTMQSQWLVAAGPSIVFVVGGAALQASALRSPIVAAEAGAALSVAIILLGLLRRHRLRHQAIPFDSPTASLSVLELSEASR